MRRRLEVRLGGGAVGTGFALARGNQTTLKNGQVQLYPDVLEVAVDQARAYTRESNRRSLVGYQIKRRIMTGALLVDLA